MRAQNRTALMLAGVAAVMVSLSFAAVPFYSWFCKVTGFGGTVAVAKAAPDRVLDQEITIRFDGTTDRGLPWEFKPMQRVMKLRIGETALAFYEAKNLSDHTIAGTAAYNVTPDAAGGFFTKIQCFCFTEQVLKPGERVEMPVSFYVDPAIVTDGEGKYVHEITLSYTFFQQPLPQDQAALESAAPRPVN